MKLWSYILGALALALTLFVGFSYPRATKQTRFAELRVSAAEESVRDLAYSQVIHRRTAATRKENDLLDQRAAELEVSIAHLQNGRGLAAAQLEKEKADAKVRVDGFNEQMSESGDPEITLHGRWAQERVDACRQSMAVWSGIVVRDQQMFYVCGVFWLAFGFAVSLSRRT